MRVLAMLGSCLIAAAVQATSFERVDAVRPTDVASGYRARMGQAVATDGVRLAVGSARKLSDAERAEGSITIYRRAGLRWVQEAVWYDLDGEDRLGWSMAIEGDTLVVGSPFARRDDVNSPATGAVRVYRIDEHGVWNPAATIFAPDGEDGDLFGYSVAMKDGLILAGAPGDDSGDVTNHGALYALTFGTRDALRQKMLASDRKTGDVLGISVALAGNRALAGAVGANAGEVPGAGAVYSFALDSDYRQVQKLVAPDAANGDGFGIDVAAEANRVVVGAYHADIDGRSDQGALHVFARSGGDFVAEAKLASTAGVAHEILGWSVALAGDAILAGGQRAAGSDEAFASLRMFRKLGGTWTESDAPVTDDPAARNEVANSVALAGEVAAAGWPTLDRRDIVDRGSALPFVRRDGAWQPTPLDTFDNAWGTSFGYAMDLDDGVAAIGGPALCVAECEPAYATGGVYVLRRDAAGVLRPEATLLPPGDDIDGFGRNVAISGDDIVVSAGTGWNANAHEGVYTYARRDGRWQFDDVLLDRHGNPVQGEQLAIDGDTLVVGHFNDAWIFARGADGWREQAHFPVGVAGRDGLTAVALDGDRVYLGLALYGADHFREGAVYVLVRNGTQWGLEARLRAADADASTRFGSNLAVDGDTLIVGAEGDSELPARQPAAYLFERGANGWEQRAKFALPPGRAAQGLGVAIHGDIAMAGVNRLSPLAVRVFERRAGEWSFVQDLPAGGGRTLAFDGVTLLAAVRGGNGSYADQFLRRD